MARSTARLARAIEQISESLATSTRLDLSSATPFTTKGWIIQNGAFPQNARKGENSILTIEAASNFK